LEARLEALENKLGDVNRSGRRAGAGVEAGMDKAARSTDRAGAAAKRATPPIRGAGRAAAKTGAEAGGSAIGLDKFARSMQKAAKKTGGLNGMLKLLKWPAIATGLFAVAGGVSALGAAGAIAVGGLAPMFGVLAGAPALLLTAKLAMLAFTLAGAQLEPQLDRIKSKFTGRDKVIAAGGLRSGLDYFSRSLNGLSKVTGKGLAG